MNICIFGDSIGKGVILQPDTSRYEVKKMDYDELFGQNDIKIKNYSMFGCTVTKGLTVVKRHIDELGEYDNIFLEWGGNDCDFTWREVSEAPDKEHFCKTPITEFRETYKEVINAIRSSGGNPIILTLPPLDPNRYFKWVSKELNGDNILKWLGDVDMIYRWQEMYNIEVMLLAEEMNVAIIDIRSAFLSRNNYRNYICGDGIHPNNDGYELIYKTIAEQYKENRMTARTGVNGE